VSKFRAVFVKFDVAYPYGDKHDNFAKLAEAAKHLDDVLIAEVPVKDYGDKENEAFAVSYGIDTKNFPQARLFVNGDIKNPVAFTGNFDESDLRQFLKSEGKVWIGLPDCIEAFDQLATEFLKTSGETERQKILARAAEAMAKEEKEANQKSAEIYIKIMQKILAVGDEFVANEEKRIKKLLTEGKVKEDKKSELKKRMNILLSFRSPEETKKDEL
jgi:endoplasmic reticulum protein 29